MKTMIPIQQNMITNDIFRHINLIRNINNNDINSLGGYEIKTTHGEIQLNLNKKELKTFQNKLKYSNIKKIFLYSFYRMNKASSLDFNFNINELLDFKEQNKRHENKEKIIEDLKYLGKIKLTNFKGKIKNKTYSLNNSDLFDTLSLKNIKNQTYFNLKAGSWAKILFENNHYSYIPKEIFTFNKFIFDISYNIIFRYINEKSKLKSNDNKFSLSVSSLLKNVELNIRKHGANKMIKKIEERLNKLSNLNWFKWSYKYNNNIKELPGRNIFNKYEDFIIDFDMSNSSIIKQ